MTVTALIARFSPYEKLAEVLLPHAVDHSDGSHDVSHLLRVWKNVSAIVQGEGGGDQAVLAAGVLLHDCVSVEKTSPLRNQASRLSAGKAAELLREIGWHASAISSVVHAIEAHSFSAGIVPETSEAKILQDADRLDAIGTIGVARCLYVGGRIGRPLYDPIDPRAMHRSYDDGQFTVDHFYTKLLGLASSFQTQTGRQLAQERQNRLRRFLEELLEEI